MKCDAVVHAKLNTFQRLQKDSEIKNLGAHMVKPMNFKWELFKENN